MKKISVSSTHIDILTQNGEGMTEDKCLAGVLSKTAEGYKFEETLRKRRGPLNPKLFDGKYCSLAKLKNGKYQIHMKALQIDQQTSNDGLAFKIYSDVFAALSIIGL